MNRFWGRASIIACVIASWATLSWAADAPSTVSYLGSDLASVKQSLDAREPRFQGNLKRLLKDADEAMTAGPWSVVKKAMTPPSGDKHDYASLAPYWWPDPSKPDGLPYIRKDGEMNPEREKFDAEPMDKMSNAAQTLALAYYFTGDTKYAERSAQVMRAWFLDDATKMNPHVKYAQFHPGSADEGVPFGVLETTRLLRCLDADAILAGSSAWPKKDHDAFKAWISEFTKYLQTSEQGKAEMASPNNHGAWYATQVATYLVYLGKTDEAKSFIEERGKHFIDAHIESDGRQPLELDRTRPIHYSRYNLQALMQLALLGDRVGVDLWNYKNAKGATLRTAFDWVMPKFIDPDHNGFQDTHRLSPRDIYQQLRWCALKYDPKYEAVIDKVEGIDRKTSRVELLWPAK